MKTCQHCKRNYQASTKNCCYQCYRLKKLYGSTHPDHWKRKCQVCQKSFISKCYNVKYCTECAYKFKLKRNLNNHRKRKNIPLEFPIKKKNKNGLGHLSKNGYVYITKVGHENAKKNGRMFEHTFVLSQYLGRPLKKNESVHHKNGIRNDNCLENLELWHKGQPPGQRLEDKINWAKGFLQEYGYNIERN